MMSTTKKIAFPLLALLAALLSFSSVSAHSLYVSGNRNMPMDQQDFLRVDKIKIKIIIIIIVKKKGVVEAQSIRLAGSNETLKANEILAEASVEGKRFQVGTLKGEHANSQIIIPDDLSLSRPVAEKLGLKPGSSLKAGRFQAAPNQMGNFEIQD
jgi:hypothetical protein